MNLPIRDQILWPLIGLLLLAVAANATFSAWWLSTRSLQSLESRQRQILGVLDEASFPLSNNVMEKLHRLTGDEFVVWDIVQGRVIAGTLMGDDIRANDLGTVVSGGRPSLQKIGGQTYLIRSERVRGMPSQRLLVLTSDESLRTVRREAIWPPLAVGSATIILLIPLTLMLASGLARRIRRMESHVQTIAQGTFGLELPAGEINDELNRLVVSINSMSRQLLSMREELIQGERTRLVAQLAAGFAHQLRNGLAGTKLALQLHESRCPLSHDASLNVAHNQLALVEEEVQGLLSLGKGESKPRAAVDLAELLLRVEQLVSLTCEHRGVKLLVNVEHSPAMVIGFADGLRAAVLNLALNAIDAAGSEGTVWISLVSGESYFDIRVEDDGEGPSRDLADSLFGPFMTSKPEGIGLGLTVAATVAKTHEGMLTWSRVDQRTRFEIKVPR